MALSDTFTTLGNTIINLVNSRTEHKQNQLVAGDGIQITENTAEKNADICIHPDIEAAFQSVIDELNDASTPDLPVLLLEDIADGSAVPPEEPFVVSTNLTEIGDYSGAGGSPYYGLLENNTYVTSADLSNLQTIGANGIQRTFYCCMNLTYVNFSNLSSVYKFAGVRNFYQTFYGCTSLTSLSFPALKSDSFGSHTSQFSNMLQGVTGCTVHFPSNLESVIGSWTDVTNGFGGTNTTVLFDLPATT